MPYVPCEKSLKEFLTKFNISFRFECCKVNDVKAISLRHNKLKYLTYNSDIYVYKNTIKLTVVIPHNHPRIYV